MPAVRVRHLPTEGDAGDTAGLASSATATPSPSVMPTPSPTRIVTGFGRNDRRQGGEGVMLAGLHEFS